MPLDGASSAAEAVNTCSLALKQEYGALEQELDVSVRQSREQVPKQVLSSDSTERLLTLLLTLPHGVQKFSHTVPGLAFTQTACCAVQLTVQAVLCQALTQSRHINPVT